MTDVQVDRHPQPLYSARTLAVRLDVSIRKARDLLATAIPSFMVDGSRRAKPEDVEAYIDSCQGRAA